MTSYSPYRRHMMRIAVLVAIYASASALLCAQTRGQSPSGNENAATAATDKSESEAAAGLAAGRDGEAISPQKALDFARRAYDRINRDVKDYTCFLISRQRLDGKLGGYRGMYVKVRHEQERKDGTDTAFAVYVRFLKPDAVAGREVLYVPSLYQGDLIARLGGRKLPNTTLQFPPDSPLAMSGNRYPITEMGMQALNRRVIELLELEQQHDDVLIEELSDVEVDDRPSRFFRLTYQKHRPGRVFRSAEIAFDNEMSVPTYYRALAWPTDSEENPVLEEYFYKRVQLNVGLTDEDFDAHNPQYRFKLAKSDSVTGID